MSRRQIRWGIAIGAAVALLGATVAWLDREATLEAFAQGAVQRSQGALTLDGVRGTLMRPIHVDRAVWRGDGREVTLDDVTVRWSPLWLLLATVSFDEVHVADATVKVRDTEATPAAPSLPKSLRLPLRVRFHGTTIDRFVFTRSEEAREAAQVRFDGEADWQSWTLSLAESDTSFGRLTGRIEVGADPPFQVNGALDVTRTGDRPLALNVVASGALARNVELDAEAPEAVFDGALDGASNNGVFGGTLKVVNRLPGTIDAHRIPLASLVAALGIDGGALTLDGIAADMGDAGKLTGSGKVSADEVALELDGTALNAHGAHGNLAPTRFTATMEMRGDLASQDVRVSLAQPAYRATFDGTIAGDAVTVRKARVAVGDGYAEAKGTVGLDADHRFDVKATLVRFDPSRIGNFKAASLNGRVDASGSVQPVVQVRAAIDIAPSTAFGLPASGKIAWRSRGVDDPRIAIDGNATIGQTRVAVKGTLVNPAELRSLDLTLSLAGRNLAELYQITGLPFPVTPDYQLDGRVRYDDRVVSLQGFTGRVGRSDVAGDFSVDRRAAKPFMRADLTSRQLDMRDLAGFIGAGEQAPPNPPGRVLPHSEFRLDKLNAANADVRLTGERIRNETLPLDRMSTHLVLRDGVLSLAPLTFGTEAGGISGKVTLDASRSPIDVALDLGGENLRLERFAPGIKSVLRQVGPVSSRVRLAMRGNSVAAMLATADGDIALAMSGGAISDLTLRLADLDVAHSLAVIARNKNRTVPVECLVGRLHAHDGVLTPQTFTLDAAHTSANVDGRIDLRNEELDLRVDAKPKDFSLFALGGPVKVNGTLADPAVHADFTKAMLRAGAAVVLGAVAPPAAALPFLQFGSRESFDCAGNVEAIARLARGETAVASAR